MDPVVDPVLFWSGKRNRRDIPLLPLQRNEVVSDSRIAQIVDRARERARQGSSSDQLSMFSALEKEIRDGDKDRRIQFYSHEEGWRNKLICGDSLHVMESLLHYEHLSGKVQMIYIDPPYGIDYSSNFQQRVDSPKNDDKDRADDVLTIKAFRDTWSLGIHSFLSHIQSRLYLCRELLSETGSLFFQIGDTNVHLARQLLDEVFGAENFCSQIAFTKTSGFTPKLLSSVFDYILWYAKAKPNVKYTQLFERRAEIENPYERYICVETPDGQVIDLSVAQKLGDEPIPEGRILSLRATDSQGENDSSQVPVHFEGRDYYPPPGRHWSVNPQDLEKLGAAGRLFAVGKTLRWKAYRDEFPFRPISNVWNDIRPTGFGEGKLYSVWTHSGVIQRCLQMVTDPGDLVLDPTCGSGTTAFCAEKLGRRWITCDTSRVAINVARRRLLSSTFEHFKTVNSTPSSGFVFASSRRVTLRSLAYGLEPERVELVQHPETVPNTIRVSGPFEVMTLGRYSAEDWSGYVSDSGKLQNYVETICRLYRKKAAVQPTGSMVHAVAETGHEKIGISVGPLSGRVTARQINDAVTDALSSGILETHVLGWAFEANVGEIKTKLESRGKVKVQLIVIRPDTLVDGLKATQAETLFSPLALPDIQINSESGQFSVTLLGVGVFDRKRRVTDYRPANKGYVAAWYLDEDYDGDCFVDCQMFYDFSKAPNLKATLKMEIDPGEYKLQLTSQPFRVRSHRRVAVKVVDVYGNESTVVRDLQ
ncbi:MAG: site-specific DNA-methyltransferase [Armatimonadota bacterium]